MGDAPRMAFAHMGIYVSDIATMANFYTRVLGFAITDRGPLRGREFVFLSRNPDEHHQIVLAAGREPGQASTVNQISFRMVSLAELRRMHTRLIDEGVSALTPINHTGSWSVYFEDPEGNRIELFVQTPWYTPAPKAVSLDLGLSDDEIYRLTEAIVERTPGHMSRTEWHERTRRRMVEEGTLEERAPAAAQ